MIPASTSFLRDRFKHVHPAHVNVSKRRIQMSAPHHGIQREGITTKLAPYSLMAPAWQNAKGYAEGSTYHRTGLSASLDTALIRTLIQMSLMTISQRPIWMPLRQRHWLRTADTPSVGLPRLNKCAALYQDKGCPKITLTVPRYEERLYSISENHLRWHYKTLCIYFPCW